MVECIEPEKGLWAYRFRKVYTMDNGPGVIDDALVLGRDRLVLEVDGYNSLKNEISISVRDFGDVCVAPGLVNAHTHLRLCHLKGKLTHGRGFTEWIKSMLKFDLNNVSDEEITKAVSEAKNTGTAFLMDITSRYPAEIAHILTGCGVGALLAYEYIGCNSAEEVEDAPELRALLQGNNPCSNLTYAGHALYSTDVTLVKKAKEKASLAGLPYSIHLSEHEEELEILMQGRCEFAGIMKRLLLPKDYRSPGVRPVALAQSLGILDEHTLAVHCVYLNDSELDILAETRTNVCLCPRSNDFLGVGRADWKKIFARGINVCLGTDGLCSNTDLNLWNEAFYIFRESGGDIPFFELLKAMTVNPAAALGVDSLYGSIARGKAAFFSVVPDEAAVCMQA